MSREINIDGQMLPLDIRWHKRARRMILRMNPRSAGVIVTLPDGVAASYAIDLAHKNKVWIANQMIRNPQTTDFEPGMSLPLRGQNVAVQQSAAKRRTVWQEEGVIYVGGDPEFFARRLTDWLKKQAREDISALAHPMAAQLGKSIKRISIKDTISRWGSCSWQGNLSFNWRLIMAPPDILHYVVAHEVSHLKHMDHSAAFWAVVEELHPGCKQSRGWLKRHGSGLQQILI